MMNKNSTNMVHPVKYCLLFLLISAINYPAATAQDCEFSMLQLEPTECNEDSMFWIEFSFDYAIPGSNSFEVLGNGTNYGQFLYGDSLYTIGPLNADCFTKYEVIIKDTNNSNCRIAGELDKAVCCDSPLECALEVENIEVSDCDSTGFITIQFDVINASGSNNSDGFELVFNGIVLESYNYDSGPYFYKLPGYRFGNTLTVRDKINQQCIQEFFYQNDDCPDAPYCGDWTVFNSMREFQCTSDSSYKAYALLEYDGMDDSLYVSFYKQDQETMILYTDLVSVNDFPYLLGEFPVGNELYYYFISEQDNPFCYTGNEWNDAPRCENISDCVIKNTFGEVYDCENEEFLIDIEFDIENPGNMGFMVRGNGVIYDTFQYGELFYTLGPIELNCAKAYEFIIIDIEKQCRALVEFEGIPCCSNEACSIDSIIVYEFNCNDDGSYDLSLDFEYQNVSNEFFDVYAGNSFIGFYKYADLPVRIKDFIPQDLEYDLIKICDNDNPGCCTTYEFIGPECNENTTPCDITSLFAEAYECSDKDFYIDLEFEITNPSEEGFTVKVNNVTIDTFKHGERFYSLGPIELDCSSDYEVIVTDLSNECSAVFAFDSLLCCEQEACTIDSISVYEFECNGDGTYNLSLDFEYQNTSNESFDVFAGSEYIGSYRYLDLPVRIKNFIPRNVEYDLIKICDKRIPDCCVIHEFIGPDCSGEEECALFNLTVLQTECIDDFFYLVIDAEHAYDLTDPQFMLGGNGNDYGRYRISDLPQALGPFHTEENITEMYMIMQNDSNCKESSELEISCDCTSNIIEIENESFSLSEDARTIRIDNEGLTAFSLELYSLDGKNILSATAYDSFTIDKSNYSAGIYVLRILINGYEKSFKVFMGD